MSHCKLIYVDCGANRGDSLESFAERRPDYMLRRALNAADPAWHPTTSCVIAFEANPSLKSELELMETRLRPRFASLRIHAETAVVGHRRGAIQLAIDESSAHRVGSREVSSSEPHWLERSRRVRAINLADWLLANATARPDVVEPPPIVVRLDVEGAEYAILMDLVTSGLGRVARSRIFLAVEWHRFLKHRALAGEPKLMDMMASFDRSFAHFNHAKVVPWGPGSKESKLAASSLVENMEKILAFMMSTSNLTLADRLPDDRLRNVNGKQAAPLRPLGGTARMFAQRGGVSASGGVERVRGRAARAASRSSHFSPATRVAAIESADST